MTNASTEASTDNLPPAGAFPRLPTLPGKKEMPISVKISLQYTIYNKFNGASSNYDGFGRDASDNNTLYALVWAML